MGLNLGKLKGVEEEIVETPKDVKSIVAAAEDGDVAAKTAAQDTVASASTGDAYADLKDVITPSAPPSVDDITKVTVTSPPISPDQDPMKIESDEAAAIARKLEQEAEAARVSPSAGGNIGDFSDVLATMDPEAVAEIESRAKAMRFEAEARSKGIDPADAREMRRDQEPQPGRGGGGGAAGLVDLAAGLIAAPIIGTAMGISKFRQIMKANKSEATTSVFSSDTLRDRIYELKSEQIQRNTVDMLNASDALGDRVRSYNDAFNASSLMPTLQAEIDKSGKSNAEFLAAVSNGTATPHQIAAARQVMGDPTVATAWQGVEEQIGKLQQSKDIIQRDFDLMHKNFSDKFDVEAETEKLDEAVSTAVAAVPAPVVEDPEEKKKLAERLREMAENLIERIKELIGRIVNMGRPAK